jgi:hypothetical protein
MGKAVRDNAVTRLGDDTINRGNHILVAKRVLIQANTVAKMKAQRVFEKKHCIGDFL